MSSAVTRALAGARTPARVRGPRYVGQVVRALARNPVESIERVREKFAEREDRDGAWPEYDPLPDAEQRLHEALGMPWPCPEHGAFASLWERLTRPLTERGLAVGRGAFGGWDDGDPALVRAAWCLTRHLCPRVVLETGVARGLTTAAVLDALEANEQGRLWSIDLPPLAESELSVETAAAVGSTGRSRWTLVKGSSRRVLPELLPRLGEVDLFIHDSMHTSRNVSFELGAVWPSLAPGGAALVDDVERNAGYGRFLSGHPATSSFLQWSDDQSAIFGCLLKPAVSVRAHADVLAR
ncbi:MAG: hypothetical protein QOF83_2971 [Solirubrobacteraceae bacterium]|nr:hypothetical protein [Solirubrobacteraceae bacterium]